MRPIAVDRCPSCQAEGSFQELAERSTWQPLTFRMDEKRGLVEDDYSSFDYGDDVRVTGYECRECGASWDSAQHLCLALVANQVASWLSLARTALTDPGALDDDVELVEPAMNTVYDRMIAYAVDRLDDSINALAPEEVAE